MDVGTAYGLPEPTSDDDLVRVGPRTPGGELLRRYWQPVARSTDASDLPREIRVLGEDLVLFRTGRGRAGLVRPRCCHRGTSLRYGKVDDDGIRCCYHGWQFAPDGRCLDQPCEPDRGRHRESVRQPWYPVVEYHGLVFAYMGPPERKPVFPRYAMFEDLREDEEVVAVDHFAFGGPAVAPCNWFQTHENNMDPLHIPILHNAISGPQFNPDLASWPVLSFSFTPTGVKAMADRVLEDGRTLHRVTEIRMPNVRIIPTPTLTVLGPTNNLSWAIPIDDTHTTVVALVRKPKGIPPQGTADFGGRTWFELDDEGHQRFPGDYEAQVGQGPITRHSEEHLASSDRGVSMVRRQFREQLAVVAAGGDPLGVSFDPDQAPIEVEAGNYVQ